MPFILPDMPVINKSCCCSLKTGAIVLGWLGLFAHSGQIVWKSTELSTLMNSFLPRDMYYDTESKTKGLLARNIEESNLQEDIINRLNLHNKSIVNWSHYKAAPAGVATARMVTKKTRETRGNLTGNDTIHYSSFLSWSDYNLMVTEHMIDLITVLVLLVILMVFNILLVYGIHWENPSFMLPYLVFSVLFFINSITTEYYFCINMILHETVEGATILCFVIIMYALIVYFWLTLYNYYRELHDKINKREGRPYKNEIAESYA